MIGLLSISVISTATAGDAKAGRALFQSNCMACHGVNADGKGPAAMALQPPPTDFTAAAYWAGEADEDIKNAIRTGSPGTSMMGFSQLSDEQIGNIIAFLKTKKP
jgi:mono/diheme cytochrome c family protein